MFFPASRRGFRPGELLGDPRPAVRAAPRAAVCRSLLLHRCPMGAAPHNGATVREPGASPGRSRRCEGRRPPPDATGPRAWEGGGGGAPSQKTCRRRESNPSRKEDSCLAPSRIVLAVARCPRGSPYRRASARHHAARAVAAPDRLALAVGDRDRCSRSAPASRSSRSTTSPTTRSARRGRSSRASPRTPRRRRATARSRRGRVRPEGFVARARRSSDQVLYAAGGHDLKRPTRRSAQLGARHRPRARRRRVVAGMKTQSRGSSRCPPRPRADRLPRARRPTTTPRLETFIGRDLRALRPAGTSPTPPTRAGPATRSSRPSTSSRRPPT